MNDLIIRPAGLADCPGIQYIHRFCDDPWREAAECRAWVERRLERRLERGFYLQIALVDGLTVGHAEYIVSDEPEERFLYLGMLQIDADYRRKGIGRRMLEEIYPYARERGCSAVVTIPDEEEGASGFYRKCGFEYGREICAAILPAAAFEVSYSVCGGVPESAVKELPFVFGLAQASSRHMWECTNRPPDGDGRMTPAVRLNGGGYAQLSYYEGGDTALALCWSANPDTECVRALQALAHRQRLKRVEFRFLQFSGFKSVFENAEPSDRIMSRMV